MNTQQKALDTIISGVHGSGKATFPHSVLGEQRGTGRVQAPEQGYRPCEHRYLEDRRRTQRSR
ncbi:MAG: hypothetical protein OXE17_01340 [Chloroflexi bacterium]|nr:hypothetical protein [Chloroflexota bacterium]